MPKSKPIGRPSKYKKEYCQKMIDFFSVSPTEERFDSEVVETGELGDTAKVIVKKKTTTKGKGVDLPTFVRFAHNIGVCDNTLQAWCKESPDFLRAYEKCQQLQEDIWKVNSLNGNYNAQFATFLGKNVYGYKDKSEVEQNHTITVMPTIQIEGGKDFELEVGEAISES